MILESKYNIRDQVWVGDAEYKTFYATCPDCLGAGEWTVVTPSGNSATIECPTCRRGFECCGNIERREWTPTVKSLTIGQIKYDDSWRGSGHSQTFKYMCVETGIGSGTIWEEAELFATEEEAMCDAKRKVVEQREAHEKRLEEQRERELKSIRRKKKCTACMGTGRAA